MAPPDGDHALLWNEIRANGKTLAEHLGECNVHRKNTTSEIQSMRNTMRNAAVGIIGTQFVILGFLFARLMKLV